MTQRSHYVAKFHLQEFTDEGPSAEPFVWLGNCQTGVVKRRSPKNFGWSRDLYDGPGGFRDRSVILESFLAQEVEGPASHALRQLVSTSLDSLKSIPPELGRYIAWAAARSLSMKTLWEGWISESPPTSEVQVLEPPPEGFADWQEIERTHTMEHTVHGRRVDVLSRDVDALRGQGWRLRLNKDDFLDLVHGQAWYFQARFFPRLGWLVLRAPPGHSFIIGDRPVVWSVAGRTDAPPSALRRADVQLVAPLSRRVCLFGWNLLSNQPETITTSEVNHIIASAAHGWIAGSTKASVRDALDLRAYH